MATLLEMYALMQPSGELYARVQAALMLAAIDVQNEATGTANHTNRLSLANVILLDPKPTATKAYRSVLKNPTIQTAGQSSTDTDIQFVVNSLIDTLADSQ